MTLALVAGALAFLVFVVWRRCGGRTGSQWGRRAVQTPPRVLPLGGGPHACPPEHRRAAALLSGGEARRRRRGRRGLLDLTVLSRGRD